MNSTTVRIALAAVRFPATPEESITLASAAIDDAAAQRAAIICFPECFVPGYRGPTTSVPPPDAEFLDRAWSAIAAAAERNRIAVVLGTERVADNGLIPSALVIDSDGSFAGFQDKNQLDPSEDSIYAPGVGRKVFRSGGVKFGVVICHEGWRYPETVRWAARQGAQVVFHPHFHWAESGSFRPTSFGDPANTFHEKAALCRAAENTIYFATVNYASDGAPTATAVARPDGTLLGYQPYGQEGVFVAELDLTAATGLLARRLKPASRQSSRRPVEPAR